VSDYHQALDLFVTPDARSKFEVADAVFSQVHDRHSALQKYRFKYRAVVIFD
jgi:hypothetical protein